MPRPSNQVETIVPNVALDEIPGIVARVRESFDKDLTKSKQWRVDQLNALDRLVAENKDDIFAAVKADIHKDSFQTFVQEFGLIQQEIYDAVKHLDDWVQDEVVPSTLASLPCQSVIQKDPYGVVLIFGAWNYNTLLSLQPMVGAIAAGNCIIMKPGSFAVNSSNLLTRLVNTYMDTNCIFAIEGDRHTSAALLEQRFDKIMFTGSKYVGRIVAEAAAKTLTPVVLELGGKSPCIVDETADIPIAVRRYAWGSFLNGGQTCVRPDYLMLHENIADSFITELKVVIKEFYGDDPKSSPFYGRLINEGAFERLKHCMEQDSSFLIHGGKYDASERYIEPSIFDFGKNLEAFSQSELMNDEIFGPLIPIFRFQSLDQNVLPFIRRREKPLALYVFTSDPKVGDRVIRSTSSGGAVINDTIIHLANPCLPFGGVGESGMGSYHGKHSFDCFSHRKSVIKRSLAHDNKIRYPPYSESEQKVISMAMNPAFNYYFGKIKDTVTDTKNVALAMLGAYVFHQKVRSRL